MTIDLDAIKNSLSVEYICFDSVGRAIVGAKDDQILALVEEVERLQAEVAQADIDIADTNRVLRLYTEAVIRKNREIKVLREAVERGDG